MTQYVMQNCRRDAREEINDIAEFLGLKPEGDYQIASPENFPDSEKKRFLEWKEKNWLIHWNGQINLNPQYPHLDVLIGYSHNDDAIKEKEKGMLLCLESNSNIYPEDFENDPLFPLARLFAKLVLPERIVAFTGYEYPLEKFVPE